MKLFTGWVMSAGLVLAATSANAQVAGAGRRSRPPYTAVSDVGGPYAAMPPEAAARRYDGPRSAAGAGGLHGVRENGFSPLGIPQQRGFFYTIAVIDRGGEDGRLVIDARDGRIVRFVPAYRIGRQFRRGLPAAYGPAGRCRRCDAVQGAPRPPASVPHVASRTPRCRCRRRCRRAR